MSTKKTHGFTLIETLLSLTILTFALGMFFSLTTVSIHHIRTAQQRHLAGQIAREGVELVMNKRDNHVRCVNDRGASCPISDWKDDLISLPCTPPGCGPGGPTTGGYFVDASTPSQLIAGGEFIQYSGNPSKNICITQDGQIKSGLFYNCQQTQYMLDGNFNRRVVTTELTDDSIRVESIVDWDGGSITLETVLFNQVN